MEALTNLGINPGFLLMFTIYFLVVVGVMTIWVYNPIVNGLENRKKKIAQGLEDARVAAEARANAESEARKIIAEAQAEANKRVAEATARAEKSAADVKAAAEAEARRIVEGAREGLTAERNQMLADLRPQVAALSLAAANRLIGQALDEKRQRALIDEFFSGVKSGKVVVVEDAAMSGASAEVTSALPLTEAEKTTVTADITGKLGGGDVHFKVDPAILGGLVVRVGDKVIDGSVAGKLEGLRQAVK
jgi:F-type H+-transporting ATPase subunit b